MTTPTRTATALAAAVLICCCVVTAAPGQAPAPAAGWQARVDQVFAEFEKGQSPGCALALYQDGKIVYEKGYGYADLEHEIRITPQSVFYVGSLSKQFTGFAAALAIERGRLRLDDDVRKFVPELPDYGTPITIRHLIHHTSGLRDINTLLAMAGRRGDEAYDNLDVLRIVARQKALNFKPGDEHLYSNSGYAMLALAIERATGVPFDTFADDNIFKPLGMTITHFHVDQSRLVKNRADAYFRAGGELRRDTPVNARAGAGGVFTTVRDLLQWDENFYTGRVGGLAIVKQVQTPGTLNNGTALTYAWGLTVGAYRGQRTVDHGGSLGGFRAHLIRFPDRHFSVACLCNMASIVPSTLVRRVADVYLGDVLAAVAAGMGRGTGPGPVISSEVTPRPAEYVGTYYSEELDTTFTTLVQEGRLMLRRVAPTLLPLTPATRDEFRAAGGLTLRFIRDAAGRVTAMAADAGRVRDIRFVKR